MRHPAYVLFAGPVHDLVQSPLVLPPLALYFHVEIEEDFRLEASPEFWRMIEERRREPTIPLEDLKAELFADEK